MHTIKEIMNLLNPFLLLVLGYFLNYKLKKSNIDTDNKLISLEKSQTSELKATQNVLSLRMEAIESIANKIEKTVGMLLDDDEMDKSIIGATTEISKDLIEKNFTIHSDYKSIISYWGELMYKFCVSFMKSPKRHNQISREAMIAENKRELMDKFKHFLKSKDRTIKIYDGAKVTFSSLISKLNIYSRLEVLILDLERNNLKPNDIVDKFERQVHHFGQDIITASVIWENLSDENKNIQKAS